MALPKKELWAAFMTPSPAQKDVCLVGICATGGEEGKGTVRFFGVEAEQTPTD